jgi:hypothetical protein
MQLTPHELPGKGYKLLDKLEHKELVPFVGVYLNRRTFYSVGYFLVNVVVVAAGTFLFLSKHEAKGFSFPVAFGYLFLGLLLTLLLIPLHEFIHVMAYRSQGAKKTSYDVILKQFVFLAIADRFVASKKEFEIVALAPFVIISGLLVAAFLVAGQNWQFIIMGMLFMHTLCCAGDFGLLSYMQLNKHKRPVTYDDKASKVSYFYGKEELN